MRSNVLPGLLVALMALVVAPAPVLAQNQEVPADGPEVFRTDTGLRYSVLRRGEGSDRPTRGDQVRFHYSGWLPDGTLFETSRTRAAPLESTLGVAMPRAWELALGLMTAGSRIKVVAPPDLCFGKWGSKGKPPSVPPVPPDTTLTFDFELISFRRGVELPRFVLPDLACQKKLPNGLEYEVLVAGKGSTPRSGERFTVEFTLWNERGQIVACSRRPGEEHIVGRIGQALVGPEFLPTAIAMLRLGGRMRFTVPPALGYRDLDKGYLLPPGSATIWELQLLRLDPAPAPRPIPAFRELNRHVLKRTASGLRYEVVKPGKGPTPGPGDEVEIFFAGWLAHGKLFSDNLREGLPMSIGIEDPRVISGLREGLLLMRPGAVFRFSIPPRLAYGMFGRKDLGIGPNRRLIYWVEVLGVGKPGR